MRKNRYVVIVDPFSTGNLYADEFKKHNIKPLALLSYAELPSACEITFRPQDFEKIIYHRGILNETLEKLRKYSPIAIIPGSETGVELADSISLHLTPNFANSKAMMLARRDKGRMGDCIARERIPHILQICTDSVNEIRKWVRENDLAGMPLVLKPPKSSGTDSVIKLTDLNKLDEEFNKIYGKINKLEILNDKVLVQEFVSGIEYVVDTFSVDGIHYVCDICKYSKVNTEHQMSIYETIEWVEETDPVAPSLINYTNLVLNALGVKFGCAHIEIMLTNDGPKLIEVGARAHGGGHPIFNLVATGDSQLHRLIDFVSNQRKISTNYQLKNHTKVVFLINKEKSQAKEINKLDLITNLKSHYKSYFNVHEGDVLLPTTDLFSTFDLGFVVLSHSSAEQVQKDHEILKRMLSEVFINI
ncbi:biotin carboxylase [Gibbsiella quercinecans]|uniref:ATP-grasp domain-containing protein n=1 Tax=Gibbsiella quercinecans TaxID=929813 RepID=UPI000BB072FE|nr:ATP-grasp domain-containing protein [Gibbsiella quercinecans]TCT88976.1 biotin carboxylase [Gibbsiella quercinecans]